MTKDGVRNKILEAVGRVVAKEGVDGTTVDAIAREAGMSKGGVLHHFSSKQDMLLGMVDLYEEHFLARRDQLAATLPPTPLRLLKATVTLMLADFDDTIPGNASVLDNAAARTRVGEMKRRFFEDVSTGARNPEMVALVMYVIDGMWMDVRFDPTAIPAPVRRKALTALLDFVDELDNREQKLCAGTPGL